MFMAALPPEMIAGIIIGVIGLPTQIMLMIKTWKAATSADKAVNHRASGTTISEDIADMRVEMRQLRHDVFWQTQALAKHIKHDHVKFEEDEVD